MNPADSHAASPMAEIVLTHPMERSVLRGTSVADLTPLVVAGRKRLATCAGVAWFRGHHLAAVNLYGGHLRVYRFDPGDKDAPPQLRLLHEMSEGVSYPAGVAASPDGSLLAVAHSMSDRHGISLHPIETPSLMPRPADAMLRVGPSFHGLSFSPDSRHLAFSDISTPGYVEVARIDSGARTCRLENLYSPLKIKGLAFSLDGRFIALAWGPNALREGEVRASGSLMLAVHCFDSKHGIIAPRAVAELRSANAAPYALECCTILPTRPGRLCRILAADQATDIVPAFDFDAEQSSLVSVGPFAAGMWFPHGIDASADGHFVAITNYGDDTLRIARVTGNGIWRIPD